MLLLSKRNITRKVNRLAAEIDVLEGQVNKETAKTKSDVERLVREVRTIYSQTRRLENEVNRIGRLMEMFGMAIPVAGIIPAGAGFFVMFIMQIAASVAQVVTRAELEKAERKREQENREMRQEWIREIQGEIEVARREAYRSIVPG